MGVQRLTTADVSGLNLDTWSESGLNFEHSATLFLVEKRLHAKNQLDPSSHFNRTPTCDTDGDAENARPENDGQRKLWVWKMQEYKSG